MIDFLNKLINIFIIAGLLFIILQIVAEIYKDIKITNQIEEPQFCIKINDEYYCKVDDNNKQFERSV